MMCRGILGITLFSWWASSATAIDRVVVEAEQLSVAGIQASGATIELDLTSDAPTVAIKLERLYSLQSAASLSKLSIACGEVIVKEPQFACRRAQLSAADGPFGAIDARVAAAYDTTRKTLSLEGSGLALAGGRLRMTGQLDPKGWALNGQAESLQIPQVRELIAHWIPLPSQYSIEGGLTADFSASKRNEAVLLRVDSHTRDLNFTNEAGDVVAEKLAMRFVTEARPTHTGFELRTSIASDSGQALAGPVLLDFGKNPLSLNARGYIAGKTLDLNEISVEQKDLLSARGEARVQLDKSPVVTQARADITHIQFPAAYTSFLQIALAATDFGTLSAAGTARGTLEIKDNQPNRVDLHIDDLDLEDPKNQFVMSDLRGDLHWVPAAHGGVEPSQLTWSKARAYGLKGGTAELNFRAQGFGFELTREARVPIFDGAVMVHSLAVHNLGGAQAELNFDAHIEPISMPLLSQAFGWPELSGYLAGRIPGLTYRNNVLALNGDLTANVFDGTITGRNFRLRDPLGPWPRLFADVTARKLDLDLVTRTFSIGSITGRLDADLKGLELFNWSPVAFDARLYSTPGDRSKHLISQRAVTSISSIGGGAGGVTKALQSGVLRFFDQFRYDRIGFGCQLRNEVCLMSGVEPRDDGYYLVKGSGLPRIDIIGNAGRVDWPQLMTQIVQGMRSQNVIVR
jgi:hypothetical protein